MQRQGRESRALASRLPTCGHLHGPADGDWRRWLGWLPLAALCLASTLGLFVVVWLLARPLALLMAAIVVASAVEPLVSRLERWLPRVVAVGLLYLTLAGAAIAAGALAVPPILAQGEQLIAVAPTLIERAQGSIDRWMPMLSGRQQVFSAVQAWVAGAGSWVVSLPMAVVSSALEVMLVAAMSAYWSIATPALHRFVLSLAPPGHQDLAADILGDVGRTVGGYIRATVINAAIVGLLVYVGLTTIGLEYALVLGVGAAFGELVPYVGPLLAAIPAVVIALLTSPSQALLVLAFYIVMQQLENHLLVPLVVRHEADIPPVLVVFALAAGGTLGGVLGVLIAVPVAGALRVLALRIVVPTDCSWSRGRSVTPQDTRSSKQSRAT